ncbi:hypothetical protein QQ045_018369 [Rhodiola kirilowii]
MAINRIKKLQLEGRKLTEFSDITRAAEVYFGRLFTTGEANIRMDDLEDIPRLVTESMSWDLLRPYTREEVRKAVFQMAPTKAPGVDGTLHYFIRGTGVWLGMIYGMR